MTDPDAIIYGMDHFRGILKISKQNIQKQHSNMINSGKIIFVEGDGRHGLEEYAPYDVIIYF